MFPRVVKHLVDYCRAAGCDFFHLGDTTHPSWAALNTCLPNLSLLPGGCPGGVQGEAALLDERPGLVLPTKHRNKGVGFPF